MPAVAAPHRSPDPWSHALTQTRFPISFDGGEVALGVHARADADLARAVRGMGLTTGVPTIVLVGAGSRPAQLARLGPLIEKVVVVVAEAVDATVVDDGDGGGLAAMVGVVRRRKKAGFPLVGVVPAGADPGGLDAQHTHFVLVPADGGADMARWTASVATALAGGNRSLALVTGGGEGAWDAVSGHVRAGRLVVAVSRTGGVADHLASALAGRVADRRAGALAGSGQVCAVDPGRGATHVGDMLRSALSRPDALGPGPGPTRETPRR